MFLYNFPEPLVTVAFHPSGYHVAVGFSDKVQFINLYLGSKDQKRRDFREIPTKNCTCVKFSNGGGLIAISSGATSQVISIFKFYSTSMQVLYTLKGHIAMISSLEWAKDDIHLYSGGTHGLIFRWNLRTGQRFDLVQIKGPNVNGMSLSWDNETMFYVADDIESLREWSPAGNKFSDERDYYGAVAVTKSNKMIFTGVKDSPGKAGNLKYFRNPISGPSADYFFAHDDKGVRNIFITSEDKYLLSTGGDGTVMIFSI